MPGEARPQSAQSGIAKLRAINAPPRTWPGGVGTPRETVTDEPWHPGQVFSQAFSAIRPLSKSKPLWGVCPPTLELCASSQSRNAGISAPP